MTPAAAAPLRGCFPSAAQVFSCAARPRRRAGSRRVPLTARERQAVDAIRLWIAETGQAPLRRELGVELGISEAAATWLVLAAAKKGWLRITPHVPRGIGVL